MNPKSLAQAALLITALAAPAAYANLITTNAGFETPLVTGPQGFNYRHTGDSGWGWTTGTRGAVQFNATYAPANVQGVGAGTQSVQLELLGDYIEQSVATTIGQIYSLSFLLASYTPPGTSDLKVSVGGVGDTLFAGTNAWVSKAFTFTATLASTSLRFTNNNTTAGFTYPHLDNISLDMASVPAPATLALVGVGLAALGWSRRQRV